MRGRTSVSRVLLSGEVKADWLMCRYSDMNMLASVNARERSAAEWEGLVKSADERFKLERIIQPPLANQAIIEIVWCGT